MILRPNFIVALSVMLFFRLGQSFTLGSPRMAFRSSVTSGISSSRENGHRIFHSSAPHMVVARDSLAETSNSGEFQRRESAWRNHIEKDGEFPPETGRYHLYVAYAW
jgi:hypothetical protein